MARRLSNELIGHAAKLYSKGLSVAKIATIIKVHPETLRKRFKADGIKVTKIGRYTAHNTISLPINEIRTMYESGTSENMIVKHFKVSRNVIRRYLLTNKIAIRTQSEAEKLKWSQMSSQQRANQVKSAHASTIGRTKTFLEKCRAAISREQCLAEYHIGIGETEFRQFLEQQGIPYTYQKAIHSYNLDFAIGNVAVELTTFTGRYTRTNSIEKQRAKNLLKCGYQVLAVEFDTVETLLHFASDIITEVDRLNGLDTLSVNIG